MPEDQIHPEDLASDSSARYAPPDLLRRIREAASQAISKRQEIAELEERLKQATRGLDNLTTKTLPELMDQAGMRVFILEATGNLPAMQIEVKSMVTANIAASWSPEKRKAAFDWLDEHGHGSLIKTEVSVNFPREPGEREGALELMTYLEDHDLAYQLKEAVNHMTLTAWLKEAINTGQELPALDLIGGYVERQAVLKDLTEESVR